MKSFFKDYWELAKHSSRWMKKHWKGYLVYCFIVAVICWFPYIVGAIRNKITENRKSEEGGN